MAVSVDRDECQDGTHDCEQVCVNEAGSYSCSCNEGYSLDGNGRNCSGKTIANCNR